MALTVNHPLLKEVTLHGYLANIGSTVPTFVVSPVRGKVVEVGSVLCSAVSNTSSDNVISTLIGGTTITSGSFTIASSGSASGDIDFATPTKQNYVNERQAIQFVSNAASTGTTAAMVYAIVRT